jgi:membrane associated rhomboid family serine protease
VLLAGIGGNWMNAAAHQAFHSSIGASTAVFGALGLLCGPAVVRRRRSGLRGRMLLTPLAAGLGLIAMLGVGGVRTDIWAHLFGFIAGVLLGLPLAMALTKPPGPVVQLVCGLAALAVTIGSWRLALAG